MECKNSLYCYKNIFNKDMGFQCEEMMGRRDARQGGGGRTQRSRLQGGMGNRDVKGKQDQRSRAVKAVGGQLASPSKWNLSSNQELGGKEDQAERSEGRRGQKWRPPHWGFLSGKSL